MSASESGSDRPKTQLAIGRSAEIIDYGNQKILKLYFDGVPNSEIETEYSNSKNAFSVGATSMKCHKRVKESGRQGIVFDKVDGISLTKLPDKQPLAFFRISKILADLHWDLHRRKTGEMLDVKKAAKDTLSREPLAYLSAAEKSKIKKIIDSLPEGDSVLHMDFHPENIIVSENSFVVIDWMTALKGSPAADVASTMFLFQDAELWPGTPKLKIIFYNIVRKFILKGYLKTYRALSGIDMEEVKRWRLPILIFRLGLWNIESERAFLENEIRNIISSQD